jgi:hypothetical protein
MVMSGNTKGSSFIMLKKDKGQYSEVEERNQEESEDSNDIEGSYEEEDELYG